MITKFASGDSIIPESNDLNRKTVPSWVKEIIFVKIFPTNSKAEEIKGAFRISNAKINCINKPLITSFQFIAFLSWRGGPGGVGPDH